MQAQSGTIVAASVDSGRSQLRICDAEHRRKPQVRSPNDSSLKNANDRKHVRLFVDPLMVRAAKGEEVERPPCWYVSHISIP